MDIKKLIDKMKTTFIYELIDPITNETRYIGKSNNPANRFSGHLKDKHKSYKSSWVKSLKNKGLKPILNIIDEVSENEWQFWEVFYISLYKSWNCRLTNLDKGGNGPNHMSENHRQKISLALKGKSKSKEHKLKMSESQKGKKASEETKKKMSLIRKGHKTSQKTIDKISKANRGKIRSEEVREKYSLAHKGKKNSEETRLKIGLGNKGKKVSEESKKRMKEAWIIRKSK